MFTSDLRSLIERKHETKANRERQSSRTKIFLRRGKKIAKPVSFRALCATRGLHATRGAGHVLTGPTIIVVGEQINRHADEPLIRGSVITAKFDIRRHERRARGQVLSVSGTILSIIRVRSPPLPASGYTVRRPEAVGASGSRGPKITNKRPIKVDR